MKTIVLRRKLLFALGSILGKLNGEAIEGLCGPGVYYGTAIAGVISRKSSKAELVERVTCAEQPVIHAVAQPSA